MRTRSGSLRSPRAAVLGAALAFALASAGAGAARKPERGIWHPPVGVSWQWQLTEPVDTRVEAAVYDVDGFDTPASVVRRLHRLGRRVICYIDAGAYEAYRPDAHRFPAHVLGKPDRPWPGERWLDIRRIDVLRPIMVSRLRMCARKGFDGVELDEVDGYANDTGFPLRSADQIRYNRLLAAEAHALGLAAGLKNDVDQVRQLVPFFDFAIDEQCFQYHECETLRPFIDAGKPVFHVEYALGRAAFCGRAVRLRFSSMRKRLNLGVWRAPCG